LLEWKPVQQPGEKIAYTVEMTKDGSTRRTIGVGISEAELGIITQKCQQPLASPYGDQWILRFEIGPRGRCAEVTLRILCG
jgi:hypothetical protein